jgi:hypothetical protein
MILNDWRMTLEERKTRFFSNLAGKKGSRIQEVQGPRMFVPRSADGFAKQTDLETHGKWLGLNLKPNKSIQYST